ncbi:hypothetical protein AB0M22_09255 [Nocardia sp. NPDC051756]|uniref:hypothetical protein n=1 Tax=Nocardia sp. NPDC051756 TaxID=3154751 RepID=UPI0034272460
MDDLEGAMAKLERLKAAREQADEAAKDALKAEHEWIRKILKAGPHGIQAELVRRGIYSRQHLDRIRRGKTSG